MKFIKKSSLLLSVIFALTLSVWAHNQSPSTIRKAMKLAFETLQAELPKNVLKGDRVFSSGRVKVSEFDAKDGASLLVGKVFQFEYQEETWVVAFKNSGELLGVLKSAGKLSPDEYESVEVIQDLKTKFKGATK